MKNHSIQLLFSILIGSIFCLFAINTILYAASEQESQKTPATIDLVFIQEDLDFLKEETVSIAAAHEQPISEAPSNVYVITAEDIRHSGATDIPTILRRIPGMEVIQTTGADYNVSARGNNQARANKLLVLVDGRSIYLDIQGEVLWKAIPVTLPEIKQIEVLKGPASALYGFNAFDGVINIITKSPEELKGGIVQFGGGELGTITSSAIYAGKHKDLGYRLSAGWDKSQQWQNSDALAYRAYKFNVQTHWNLQEDAQIKLQGGYLNSNRYDGPAVDTLRINQEPSIGHAGIGFHKSNFFLRTWWTRVDQDSDIETFPTLIPFFQVSDKNGSQKRSQTWNSYNIESQHALEFGNITKIIYGLNFRHNSFSSNFLKNSIQENRLGFYVQDELNITPKFIVTTGLRLDLHTEINPTYSPRVALVYRPETDHTLRTSFGIAYRPPTVFETATDSRGSVFPFGCPPTCFVVSSSALKGSDNLRPEKIIATEVGYQGWFFKHRLRLRIDLFYNHISNIIQQGGPTGQLSFINSRKVDIYGGEAGLEFLIMPWLTGFANYSFQDINQQTPIASTTLDRREGPQSKANGGLRAEWDNGINGEMVLHYVGATTSPLNPFFTTASNPPFNGSPPLDNRIGSYFLLNLRGAYRFWNDHAEIAVTSFNSFNDRHKEHPTGDTIKNRVMGWLTIKY